MTAALHDDNVAHDGESAERYYPERISIRLNEATKRLYAELEDAYLEDGITLSHRVLALVDLFWAEATPEQRQRVIERANEIRTERHDSANQARSRGIYNYLASDELKARRRSRQLRKEQLAAQKDESME